MEGFMMDYELGKIDSVSNGIVHWFYHVYGDTNDNYRRV